MLDVKRLLLECRNVIAVLQIHIVEENGVKRGLTELPVGHGLVPVLFGTMHDAQIERAERGLVLMCQDFFECIEHMRTAIAGAPRVKRASACSASIAP